MKKLALILMCVCLLSAPAAIYAEADTDITVYLNGKALDFDSEPIIVNNRTLVPVRKIFEEFNMNVLWDGANQTVRAYDDFSNISLGLGSHEMQVDGENVYLDTAPILNMDKTFVPLRAISEAVNCKVLWLEPSKSVIIYGGSKPEPSAAPEPYYSPSPSPAATARPTMTPQATARPTATPQATTRPTATPAPTAGSDLSGEAAMEREVSTLVNQERAQNGLSPLTLADDLTAVARAHSRDMIDRNFFSHTNPDGQSPFDRLRSAGISYRAAAENIAYGQRTAEAVMNSWMNSSGHRANILSANVSEIGIGAVKSSSGTVYWTQVFVRR